MNRKGFTLIELLAVIVLIAIIGVIVAPNLLETVDTSKEASYKALIESINIAAENYYQECEYGDLLDGKYGTYACSITNNKVTTTLGALANTGFLKVTTTGANKKKIVQNPINNNDISNCTITITKSKDANGKVTFTVTPKSGTNCPTSYQ